MSRLEEIKERVRVFEKRCELEPGETDPLAEDFKWLIQRVERLEGCLNTLKKSELVANEKCWSNLGKYRFIEEVLSEEGEE